MSKGSQALQCSEHTTQKTQVSIKALKGTSLIPTIYIEQVKDLKVDPVRYLEAIDKSLSVGGLLLGCFVENRLQGFCWCHVDPLENDLWINCYSIDRSLWHTREHFKSLITALRWVKLILNVNAVRWFTNRPALYERLGYARSKRVLMEA